MTVTFHKLKVSSQKVKKKMLPRKSYWDVVKHGQDLWLFWMMAAIGKLSMRPQTICNFGRILGFPLLVRSTNSTASPNLCAAFLRASPFWIVLLYLSFWSANMVQLFSGMGHPPWEHRVMASAPSKTSPPTKYKKIVCHARKEKHTSVGIMITPQNPQDYSWRATTDQH